MPPPSRRIRIAARKYGSRYVRRAAATAATLPASRLKNQMPGLPSRVAYVRTLSSGKRESSGAGGVPRRRSPLTSNGVMPSQALPSNVSSSSGAGRNDASSPAGTGQCANSRSSHVCAISHGPAGRGHGRCASSATTRPWETAGQTPPRRARTASLAPAARRSGNTRRGYPVARLSDRRPGQTRGMDLARVLAGGLAVSRILFGATYLTRPEQAGPSWIGRAARKPGTQVMIRSQGARDVALGLGALWALVSRPPADARPWMAAHALADGADAAVTWIARERLPKRRARLALGVALGSTAVALFGAARSGQP